MKRELLQAGAQDGRVADTGPLASVRPSALLTALPAADECVGATRGCDPMAVTDLVGDWRKTWAQWVAANDAGRSVTARNEIMDRIWALGREIALQPDLHEPVEALCDPNQDPDTRLQAALVREHWDSVGAAETLVAIIRDSGATLERPLNMSIALSINTTQTAKSAALCLFNIDRGTGNIGTVS